MIRKKWLAVAALFGGSLCAQNPVVPPGVFAADPEGHQWKDGRLYLYVSRDESPDFYCSWRYDLLSTDDLKNWRIHRDAFASKGPNDEVPYSDGELYASDAAYKDGKYYLYYSMRDAIDEGVAVADAPAGRGNLADRSGRFHRRRRAGLSLLGTVLGQGRQAEGQYARGRHDDDRRRARDRTGALLPRGQQHAQAQRNLLHGLFPSAQGASDLHRIRDVALAPRSVRVRRGDRRQCGLRSRVVEQSRLDLRVRQPVVRAVSPDDERNPLAAEGLHRADRVQRGREHRRGGDDLAGRGRSTRSRRSRRGAPACCGAIRVSVPVLPTGRNWAVSATRITLRSSISISGTGPTRSA